MAEHRSPKPGVRGSTPFSPANIKKGNKMGKINQGLSSLKTFISEVKVELVKCAWPTRKELLGQSVVVIVAVIILGAFVGLCDVVNVNLLGLIIR